MIPSTGYPYWMFGALTMQNGPGTHERSGNETYFDSPAVGRSAEFWRDLGDKHGVMPAGTIEWGTLRQNFLEGKTAIMWHSTGNLTTVKKKRQFDFGVAMLPAKQAPRHAHRRRQLLHLQEDHAGRTQGGHDLHQVDDQPERTAEWSMKTGYIGTRPTPIRHRQLRAMSRSSPRRGGPGPARVRHRRAVHLSDGTCAQASGRRHPVR